MTPEEIEKEIMKAYIQGFQDAATVLVDAAKEVNISVFETQLKEAKEKLKNERQN